MLSVRIAGHRLAALAPHGPVTVEYGEHGSELASWSMDPNFRHPALRGNAPVAVWDGGLCIWIGTLVEPGSDGEYTARGLWRQAEGVYPMNVAGDLTTNIDDALVGGIVRLELDWALRGSISAADWGTEATGNMTLAQLLDGYAAENALRWWIAPDRGINMTADPGGPQWIVPHAVAGRGLTPAEDEFFTHLVGRYLDTGGLYKTETVGSAEASDVFGRRSALVDLTDAGNITSTRASEILTGMLLKSGARMGWGEGLELTHGQITTLGGTPAALNQIQSLQMVRLAGTVDTSRPHLFRTFTDIVLRSVRYTDGSQTISATPFGYAPRNMADALEIAIGAAS